jgi:hypothetical protein
VEHKKQVLACCKDMLTEPVVDTRHKPTIGAEARGKSDRMDKDCLYRRPKQETACRHTDMASTHLSTKTLVRRSFFLSAFLSPHFTTRYLS